MYIDESFIKEAEELDHEIRKKFQGSCIDHIALDDIMKVSYFIDDLRPKSKYREYKYNILNYLREILKHDGQIKDNQLLLLKQKYLEKVIFLLATKFGFYRKGITIFVNLTYGFLLDIFCLMLGISKNYYYFPFFTLLSLGFFLIKKAEKIKQNKFLRI